MTKKAQLQAMSFHGLGRNQVCIDGMTKKAQLQAMPCHSLGGSQVCIETIVSC